MRYADLIAEGKWWDASDTITLYHGTSTAMLPAIEEHGLSPIADLKAFTRDLLAHYIPESDWTPELLQLIDQRAVREFGGRNGDFGAVLFLSNDIKVARGYAEGNCQHGGEVAHDVYTTAKLHLAGEDMSWTDFQNNTTLLQPKFAEGLPVVLEVEVPKAWVMMPKQETDIVKANMKKAWDEKRGFARGFSSFEDLLDDVWLGKEFRVKQAIPTSMIVQIHRF